MQQWVQCVTAEGGEGDRIVLLAPMHTKEVNYQKIFRNLEQSRSTDGASAGPRAGAEIAFFIFMIIFWLSRGCGCGGGPGSAARGGRGDTRRGLYNASESGDSFSGEKTAKLAT